MADAHDDIIMSEHELSDSSSSTRSTERTPSETLGEYMPIDEDTPPQSEDDWVAPEPEEYVSEFADFPLEAFTQLGTEGDWAVHLPEHDDRICSSFRDDMFPMYEYVFKEMRLRLPFSDFQIAVFNHLELSPSQLHPNSFGLIKAFELTCEYLKIGATIHLFLYIFHLQ